MQTIASLLFLVFALCIMPRSEACLITMPMRPMDPKVEKLMLKKLQLSLLRAVEESYPPLPMQPIRRAIPVIQTNTFKS